MQHQLKSSNILVSPRKAIWSSKQWIIALANQFFHEFMGMFWKIDKMLGRRFSQDAPPPPTRESMESKFNGFNDIETRKSKIYE